jgi:hypothetical protein
MRMSHESESRPPGSRVLAVLRALYGAPQDERYWSGLESRIMARVATSANTADEWWLVFGDWARAGLVAAAIALVVAAATLAQARATEGRLAYEAVLDTPPTAPLQTADRSPGLTARQATLEYVSPH